MVQLFTSTAFSVPVEAAGRLERETPSSSPQDERTPFCCPIRQPAPYHLEATASPADRQDRFLSPREALWGNWPCCPLAEGSQKASVSPLLSFLSLCSKVIFLCPVSTVSVESHLQLLRAWGGGARTNLLCFLARCHREAVFVEETFSKGKAVGTGCLPYVRDTERAS